MRNTKAELMLYNANIFILQTIKLKISVFDKYLGVHYTISPVDSFLAIKGFLLHPEEMFIIVIVSHINPSANTELLGLYK